MSEIVTVKEDKMANRMQSIQNAGGQIIETTNLNNGYWEITFEMPGSSDE